MPSDNNHLSSKQRLIIDISSESAKDIAAYAEKIAMMAIRCIDKEGITVHIHGGGVSERGNTSAPARPFMRPIT